MLRKKGKMTSLEPLESVIWCSDAYEIQCRAVEWVRENFPDYEIEDVKLSLTLVRRNDV